jgi:hypothetical protein
LWRESSSGSEGRIWCFEPDLVDDRRRLLCSQFMAQSQWLFPTDALAHTPTVADGWAVDKELYDRSRGAELLYRLGSSLALSVRPLTWTAGAMLG